MTGFETMKMFLSPAFGVKINLIFLALLCRIEKEFSNYRVTQPSVNPYLRNYVKQYNSSFY